MVRDEPPNPFQPGTGSYPPVLAGREAELSALHRLLRGLEAGTLNQMIHLLLGPRGLGKTVLLQAMESEASVRVEGVDVVRISAGDMPDFDELARLVEPHRSALRGVLGWVAGVSALGVRLQRPTDTGGTARNLPQALQRRSQHPLLLTVDEAHVLAPKVCQTLLNAFQNLAARHAAHCCWWAHPRSNPY